MDGPERLEAGPPSARTTRPARWVAVGLPVAVLGVLLAIRVGAMPQDVSPGPGPSTGPSSSAPTTAVDPDPRAWPAALRAGSGTLYLAASRSVLAVDAGSGLVSDTGVQVTGPDARLTALSDGLLVWYPDGRPGRLLLFGLDTGTAPGGGFARADRVLPAAGGAVWAARLAGDKATGRTTWRRVDADGRVTGSVALEGRAVGDGSGGLLVVADGTVRAVWPPPTVDSDRRPDPGAVVATGPDGYLVQRCTGGACTTVLREGSTRTRRVLDVPVSGSAVDGALSPGNRLVLLSQLEADAPVVTVSPLGSDRPLRTFPGAGSGAVWLSERWVAFVGRDGLVLYDAVDDRVVPSGVPGVVRLAWQPA